MKILNRYRSPYDLLLPLGDAVGAALLIGASRALLPAAGAADAAAWNTPVLQAALMALVVVLAFYFADLYAVDTEVALRDRLLGVMKGFGIVCVVVGGLGLLTPSSGLAHPSVFELALVGSALGFWHQRFARGLKNGPILSRILIVGTQPIGRLVAEQIHLKKHLRMAVVGFIGSRFDSITLNCGNPKRVIHCVFPPHEILNLVEFRGVDRILVTRGENCDAFPAEDLMAIRLRGLRIEDCHSFCERVMSRIPIADLQPQWLVLGRGFRRTAWLRFAKRASDIVVAILCALVTAPICLLAAIAIKLDSAGPVFYSQERAGLFERPFTLYKFRSMVRDAEADSGPMWAGGDDPRVTRVGKILRLFRIDELPQLVNVLRGEMSMVGPRPERPFFVARFKETIPYYHLRFAAKPGITGWAQVSYPYAATDEDALEKLTYELYYIKNISFFFDLQILFLTLKIVLLGRGAQ